MRQSRIIGTINEEVRARTIQRCRDRNILIPTFAQLRDPELVPSAVKERLPDVGLWDVDPANLFRITWKNDVQTGLFGGVNYVEIPRELTGIRARVIGRQVLSDRRAQSRCRLWLFGSAAC